MKVETPKQNEIPKKGDTIKVYDTLYERWVDAKVMSEPREGAGSWWGSWGFKIKYKFVSKKGSFRSFMTNSFTTYQNKRWEIGGM